MKLIVAGSRTITVTIEQLDSFLAEFLEYSDYMKAEIVSGMAQGVDKCGEKYANWYKLKLHKFPADWEKFGKAAGIIRNHQMAEFADAALVIWDGKSRGSMNMKATMKKLGKPVCEVIIPDMGKQAQIQKDDNLKLLEGFWKKINEDSV